MAAVALVSLLAPTASEGYPKGPGTASAGSSAGSIEEDHRFLTVEAGGGKASQQKEEEEQFEMQLGPVETAELQFTMSATSSSCWF